MGKKREVVLRKGPQDFIGMINYSLDILENLLQSPIESIQYTGQFITLKYNTYLNMCCPVPSMKQESRQSAGGPITITQDVKALSQYCQKVFTLKKYQIW